MTKWKGVSEYEGLYEVSSSGLVRSLDRTVPHSAYENMKLVGRIKKQTVDNQGYSYISLCKNGKCLVKRVHRLVAATFLPKSHKKEVNHKNGKKSDNRKENLEWCTALENTTHAFKNKLMNRRDGEQNGNSKLTLKQVKEIKKKYIPRKYHMGMLANEYSVIKSMIHFIISGQNWRSKDN